ncbi:hypothetical protein TNCV_2747771 [Trichonephila clavipes]|nr:hypothetical protein TNCV_2747771 [Trichonephila clavipes]
MFDNKARSRLAGLTTALYGIPYVLEDISGMSRFLPVGAPVTEPISRSHVFTFVKMVLCGTLLFHQPPSGMPVTVYSSIHNQQIKQSLV